LGQQREMPINRTLWLFQPRISSLDSLALGVAT
jgi:hypothetical protein